MGQLVSIAHVMTFELKMNNWMGPTVKHALNIAMHDLHIFVGC